MSASTIMVTRLGEVDLGTPAEHRVRLGGIPHQQVDLGGAQEPLVDDDVLLPVQPGGLEGEAAELAHGVRLTRRHDVVVRRVLLQHQPHRPDVVGGVAPVALGVEIAQRQLVVELVGDARHPVGHLARDELEAAARGLVVEQDARRGVQPVALAVVDGDPVAVDLRHAVGAARVERRRLALGHLLHLAEHLRRAGLVEADLGVDQADGIEHPRHPQCGRLARQHGLGEAGLHEGLGRQVVDLRRPVIAQDVDERHLVEKVARYELDLVLNVRDALEVQRAGPPHHADHRVTLRQAETRPGTSRPGPSRP